MLLSSNTSVLGSSTSHEARDSEVNVRCDDQLAFRAKETTNSDILGPDIDPKVNVLLYLLYSYFVFEETTSCTVVSKFKT